MRFLYVLLLAAATFNATARSSQAGLIVYGTETVSGMYELTFAQSGPPSAIVIENAGRITAEIVGTPVGIGPGSPGGSISDGSITLIPFGLSPTWSSEPFGPLFPGATFDTNTVLTPPSVANFCFVPGN